MPYSAISQEYSYTHYDIADGLAGSTVYCIAQDRDGFIWAATETGVSRFDGTHFRNFTVLDGLPDNEVLQLFGDKRGRMWMAPFRKTVCYWYQGRIYTQENDSLLRRIQLRQNIENFAEDVDGNILIQESSRLHLLSPGGEIKNFDSLGGLPVFGSAAVCLDSSGHFKVQVGRQIYRFVDHGFRLARTIDFQDFHPNYIAMSASYLVWRTRPVRYEILSVGTGKVILKPFEQDRYRHISFSLLDDSLLYTNEIVGCTETNCRQGTTRSFLPGKPVSRVFRDMDGNLWFSTLGQGIYRLNSDQFGTKTIPIRNAGHEAVMSIMRLNGKLWVGTDRNQIFRLSLPDLKIGQRVGGLVVAKNRILYLDTISGNRVVFGSDNGLSEMAGPEYRDSPRNCRNDQIDGPAEQRGPACRQRLGCRGIRRKELAFYGHSLA